MNRDEIHLASFPFGGSAGMKLRPVLLLTGPVGSVPEVLTCNRYSYRKHSIGSRRLARRAG